MKNLFKKLSPSPKKIPSPPKVLMHINQFPCEAKIQISLPYRPLVYAQIIAVNPLLIVRVEKLNYGFSATSNSLVAYHHDQLVDFLPALGWEYADQEPK